MNDHATMQRSGRPSGRLRRVGALLLAGVLLGVVGCSGRNAGGRDQDWPLHGRDDGEQRFSPLQQVSADTVSRLGVAWYADFNARSLRGVEGTPIVVDGVMYATGPWSKVMAVDAASGRRLWDYDPEVPGAYARKACCDVVNRGPAFADGKVFVGALDGRLIALDAKTGKPVWSVLTVDQDRSYTITGAPRVAGRLVIIGNGGAEYGVRGYVSAYHIDTGKLAWRFYTVPGDPKKGFENKALEMAARTWKGEWWRYGGGGTAWDSFAYDPDLDLLYIGVGNGGPWNTGVRSPGGGDNLFLSSIVAVRPKTGAYVWHFQETPGDQWDYTATQHMILADLKVDGQVRKVLMQAPKNGFFYVLDRKTGQFISGKSYVPVTWAKGLDPRTGRPQIAPEARYSVVGKPFLGMPSPAGGHSWQPMSFSQQTGLVYFPAQEMVYGYNAQPTERFQYNPRGWNTGEDPSKIMMPEDPKVRAQIRGMMKGKLVAWDPVAQKIAWSVPMATPWNGGALSTAGGLVFEGNGEGYLVAYRADTGQRLWSKFVGSGIVAPPITYAVGGVQYVAVAVGWGGVLPLNFGEPLKAGVPPRVNRIVAFRLDGAAAMPLPQVEAVRFDPPPSVAPAKVIDEGRRYYHATCWMCHGEGAVNNGGVPNLRRSAAIGDKDVFRSFVLEGAAEAHGMPNFGQDYTPVQADAIRAYLVKRANDLKADPSLP